MSIKCEIANILVSSETLNQLLATETCPERKNLILSSITEINSKVKKAMNCAGALFETNMQCMSHILALKSENALLQEKHGIEIEKLVGRIDSLLAIVKEKQEENQYLTTLNSLKGI